MKNYIILFCFALFFGCDKIPSGIVENPESNFQVLEASAPAGFTYAGGDSSFAVSLKLSSDLGSIKEAWAEVYSPDNTELNSGPVSLKDDGDAENGDAQKDDNIYSGKITFSQSFPNGSYRIDYYVLTKEDVVRKVAENLLQYDNNQIKYPPAISNLVMPDSINAGEWFIFTLRVNDPNGLQDIKRVSFKFIRKENSTSSDIIDMWDDGNLEFHGDSVAGDGIFSFKNYFTQDTKGKTREFIFQAVDRNDSLSNIITHNIYVK
ncbi:MAG: hypothetical protein HF314_01910 [Ignavibacteria bacterium]|jgi:hypothetical protein|nr:hypothetical protein [Ignavibacteria bacterium]MCU7501799.1 hypothetical protein [Ignavibacteria bacterium]MCU7518280.1 hypothetical protein [Ignavibacteria bacterium]